MEELTDDLKEMLKGYLGSAQNALVRISAEITRIEGARVAQLKEYDTALGHMKEQKANIEADVSLLMKHDFIAKAVEEAKKVAVAPAPDGPQESTKPVVESPAEKEPAAAEEPKSVDGDAKEI